MITNKSTIINYNISCKVFNVYSTTITLQNRCAFCFIILKSGIFSSNTIHIKDCTTTSTCRITFENSLYNIHILSINCTAVIIISNIINKIRFRVCMNSICINCTTIIMSIITSKSRIIYFNFIFSIYSTTITLLNTRTICFIIHKNTIFNTNIL